jgi:SAM-dependent methyltransferase
MKKDMQSYEKHNSQYLEEINSYESTLKIIEKYDKLNQFKITGFEMALKLTKELPGTVVDIGSGTGWLVQKLSPFFEKIIALEPSEAALKVSQKINNNLKNIEYINKAGAEFIKEINFLSPIFITTSVVLNHIEDGYVKKLLFLLNKLPDGSVLFFDERYDKNTNWNMWHVRSKDWWRENLPNWQLIFLDIENSGYASGIYGMKVADDQILKTHERSRVQKITWGIDYFYNIFKRVIQKLWRVIKK